MFSVTRPSQQDGDFGPATERAVKRFQKAEKLAETGKADYDTWAKLDEKGSVGVSHGRVGYAYEETLVGSTLGTYGMHASYGWAEKEKKLEVTVNIKFTNLPGEAGNISKWVQNLWNIFKITYKKDKDGQKKRTKDTSLDLEFVVGTGGGKKGPVVHPDNQLLLWRGDHPTWKNRNAGWPAVDKKTRSDGGNWWLDDPGVQTMVGHEFGHLIGLEDEYARSHADITRITGNTPLGTDAKETLSPDQKAKYDQLVNAITAAKDLKGSGAGVLFNIGSTGTTSGTFSFNQAVTAGDVTNLKAGLWYFNVHSVSFPGGEIRGQIEPDCSSLPSGPVSWWQGEGNALDQNALSNGTPQGSVTYVGGRAGRTFRLGGNGNASNVGDRVIVGNPTNLQLQDFTIEGWIRRSSSTITTNSPVSGVENGTIFAYGQNGYGLVLLQATGRLALTKIQVDQITSTATQCTYCTQRISAARIEAEKDGRKVRDGEVLTACQSACPADAIYFGDMNDKNSKVSKMKADRRDYNLLNELNTQPRTTYLAGLKNQNKEMPDNVAPKKKDNESKAAH